MDNVRYLASRNGIAKNRNLPVVTSPSGSDRNSRPLAAIPEPVRQQAYTCSVCKDMGFTRHNVPFGHPLFGKLAMCQCRQVAQAHKALSKTYAWLGASEDVVRELEGMTFTSFNPRANGESVAQAYKRARGYAEVLKAQIIGGKNGLFIGPLGVGKTHLAAATLNVLRMAGYKCLFAGGNELFQALFDSDFDESILKDAIEADIFCLDDMDKMQQKKDGTYQRSTLFDLLNKRYLAKKPTIITSNEANDWRQWMHPAILSRLFGRDKVEAIAITGRDYRMMAGG